MSFSSTTSRNDYTGNNTTATYSFTFRILSQDDLLVTIRNTSDVETTQVLTTNYTVTGVGASGGGSITLVAGNLATGYILTIRRVLELTQETDIRNQGAFYPEVHEDQFDRGIMIDQQQQDEIDRSVKLPETVDPADFDATLPVDIVGVGGVTIVTNSAGDGLEAGPTATAISNAQANATAAAASATAAASSATSASGSASAAALSASAAAASSAASQWNDIQYLTFASSPFAVTDAMVGTLFEVDATGGAVAINLPAISTLTLSGAWSIGIKKTDSSSNAVTVSRNGTDTIDGATTKATSRQYGGFVLVPDIDPSPDKWTSISFGEVPIAGAIVGTTDTQTLTNKTFGDSQILTDISTPATPSAGFKKAYSKTDGVYFVNSSGVERRMFLKTPTIQRFTTGSGTYTTPAGVLYIEVEMCGGGGGGGSGGSSTAGSNTTFGTGLLLAGGGGATAGAGAQSNGGAGGTNTVSAPATAITNLTGGRGAVGQYNNLYAMGGNGGVNPFGGAGGGGIVTDAAIAGATNSGAGGGGGSTTAADNGGHGGGAGGYIKALIDSPLDATYAYAVGAGGAGAATVGNIFKGESGGSGVIIVKEFYR